MENNTINSISSLESIFGKVVFAYTRAMALEDGVLVDVTDLAATWGFRFHVAMTDRLTCSIIGDTDRTGDADQERKLDRFLGDVAGRLRLLTASDGARLDFTCTGCDGETDEAYTLCHCGDNGEPCLTIMLKGED